MTEPRICWVTAAIATTVSEAADVCSSVAIQEPKYRDMLDVKDIWFWALGALAAWLVLCMGVLCGCVEMKCRSQPKFKAAPDDWRTRTFVQTEELAIHPLWCTLLGGTQKEISVRGQAPPRLKRDRVAASLELDMKRQIRPRH